MKRFLRSTLLFAVLGGSALAASPASATSVSIGVSFPGVGFSYSSGGYCDEWGCPGAFWNYPVYYCPVYYGNRWYRGPVYYRSSGGEYLFWVHGGWRRDYWNGPRPRGACVGRYGPPLDLDFYIWNGFRIRDDWRYSWYRERNDWWRHRQEWNRSFNNDTRWRNWLPAQQRAYDWNRERNWNGQRDWTRRDWNRTDWERRNGITPPVRTQPVTSPPVRTQPAITSPPVTTRPADNRGRNRDRFRGGRDQGGAIAPTVTSPPSRNPPAENRDRFRDRSRGGRDRSEMAPTAPTNNPPSDNGGRNRDRFRGGRDQGGMAPPSRMAPEAAPAPRNPPAGDNGGRNRDRVRGGRGEAPTVAPTNNRPADNNGENRGNKKDRKNKGDNPY